VQSAKIKAFLRETAKQLKDTGINKMLTGREFAVLHIAVCKLMELDYRPFTSHMVIQVEACIRRLGNVFFYCRGLLLKKQLVLTLSGKRRPFLYE